MVIRPALEGDITPALAVMSQAFDLHLRAPTVHTLVAASDSGVLLVAEDAGDMVGTAASVRLRLVRLARRRDRGAGGARERARARG